MKRKLLFIIFLIFCLQLFGLDVAGEFSSYYGWQAKDVHNILIDRNQLLIELSQFKSRTTFFSSLQADYNGITQITSFSLKEGYFDYLSDSWDVRVGRQIIAWGKADGLRVTDIICPQDYTLGLSQDIENSRLAVDACKFSYYPDFFDFDLICLPYLTMAEFPIEDTTWNVIGYKNVNHNLPVKKLESMQVAGRLGKNLGALDFAVSGYYFWLPVRKFSRGNLQIDYKRTGFLGLEASATQSAFVYRMESAYYGRELFVNGSVEKPFLKGMFGVDWYLKHDLTITAQLAGDLICNYSQEVQRDESESLVTLTLSKKVLRQQLEMSTQILNSLARQDVACKFSLDYDCSQGLHILAGYDYYDGSRLGNFGAFSNNSMAWCKAEYSF